MGTVTRIHQQDLPSVSLRACMKEMRISLLPFLGRIYNIAILAMSAVMGTQGSLNAAEVTVDTLATFIGKTFLTFDSM